MVKKGKMIGHHRLDNSTSRPVAMANSNRQGVTSEMRDRMYGKTTNYIDAQLSVGSTVSTGLRTSDYFTVALAPTVFTFGNYN